MSFEQTSTGPDQEQLEKDYVSKFMNRDKSLKWVNALFIFTGGFGFFIVVSGFFSAFLINLVWGAKITTESIQALVLYLLLPFLSLFIPYFLNRSHMWAYWLGIFMSIILVIFLSTEFLFHSTQGVLDIVRYPFSSLAIFIFVVLQLVSIKTIYRIQKNLA